MQTIDKEFELMRQERLQARLERANEYLANAKQRDEAARAYIRKWQIATAIVVTLAIVVQIIGLLCNEQRIS